MEYRIEDVGDFDCRMIKNLGGGQYVIRINDVEHRINVISMSPRGIEFMLGASYHSIAYNEISTAGLDLDVDGTPIRVTAHPKIDDIVYKNSGGGGQADSQLVLRSQIPGKVVSVVADAGSQVAKGDIVCTLESMKMQVGIRAHKAGTVKSVRVSSGDTIAKNDIIAEIE